MEIEYSYNYFLVALSFFISVFGSFTGLQLSSGIRESSSSARPWWIVSSAIALGGGAIWTMHFIGMIAYQSSMPVMYAPGLTFFSLGIAVLVVGIGIYIVSSGERSSIGKLIIAGLIMGLGILSMHYSGMEAMVMAADMEYNIPLFILSLVIAVGASTAALWLSFNEKIHKLISSTVMGIAVCGMHYVGVAAMTMVPNNNPIAIESSMAPLTMGLFIFCFSMLLLVLCLIVALSQLNKRMYEELELEAENNEAQPETL